MGTRMTRRSDDYPVMWRSEDGRVTILALKGGGATLQVTIGGTYMGAEISPAEVVEVLAYFKDLSHADPIEYNYNRAQALDYEARRAYKSPEGE